MSLTSKPNALDLEQGLFAGLNQIRERMSGGNVFREASPPWYRNKNACRMQIDEMIAAAVSEIRVVSYSFTTYKDEHESAIKLFLRRRGRLRVLMVDPKSPGFLEKTALEAFIQEDAIDFTAWQRITKAKRIEHESDIMNSMLHLIGWRENFSNQVDFRFYPDTPNMSGMLFDDSAMFFSSYFIDPVSRGFENPAAIAPNVHVNPNLAILHQVFSNWFEVKFATGREWIS